MRFAIGGAARHRRSDARRDIGIEKIDVEADMQQAVGFTDGIEHPAHDGGHALLVERTHVEDVDAMLANFLALARVDGTDANLEDLRRIDQRPPGRQNAFYLRLAAIVGDRHAVNIARWRGGGRIEIGVSVEPEHEERTTDFRCVAGHAGDAAHGEAVVATKDQREAAR